MWRWSARNRRNRQRFADRKHACPRGTTFSPSCPPFLHGAQCSSMTRRLLSTFRVLQHENPLVLLPPTTSTKTQLTSPGSSQRPPSIQRPPNPPPPSARPPRTSRHPRCPQSHRRLLCQRRRRQVHPRRQPRPRLRAFWSPQRRAGY